MSLVCLPPEELSLEVIRTGHEIGVTWLGRASGIDQTDLVRSQLRTLLVEARESQRPLKLRFETAQHLDSTSLMLLTDFLIETSQQKIHVVVTYDADRAWQRLSFRVVEQLARNSDWIEAYAL